MATRCEIEVRPRNRRGCQQYWCMQHFAPAFGDGLNEPTQCAQPNFAPPAAHESLSLNPLDYPGGIALWGAVPAIFDSTSLHIA